MPVGVGEGLELEEFGAELAEVDCEGAGGGRAAAEGLREEFVVGLGAEGFFKRVGGGGGGCVSERGGCGCVSEVGGVEGRFGDW